MLEKKIENGLDTKEWETGKDVWEWWIAGKNKNPDCEGQEFIFDDLEEVSAE